MGGQRNMPQVKEKENSPEELNAMEANNIPDTEFKVIVVKMLKELRGRMNELSENLNKYIVNIKKPQKVSKEPVRNEEHNI